MYKHECKETSAFLRISYLNSFAVQSCKALSVTYHKTVFQINNCNIQPKSHLNGPTNYFIELKNDACHFVLTWAAVHVCIQACIICTISFCLSSEKQVRTLSEKPDTL